MLCEFTYTRYLEESDSSKQKAEQIFLGERHCTSVRTELLSQVPKKFGA